MANRCQLWSLGSGCMAYCLEGFWGFFTRRGYCAWFQCLLWIRVPSGLEHWFLTVSFIGHLIWWCHVNQGFGCLLYAHRSSSSPSLNSKFWIPVFTCLWALIKSLTHYVLNYYVIFLCQSASLPWILCQSMVLPLGSHLIKTSGSCYKLLHSLALRESPRLIDIPFSPYFFVSANLIQPQHFSR